jgi:hypothetical protein
MARCALSRSPTATQCDGRRGATLPQLWRERGGSMPSGARPRPDYPSPLSRRPPLLPFDVGGGVPLLRRRRGGLLRLRLYAGGHRGACGTGGAGSSLLVPPLPPPASSRPCDGSWGAASLFWWAFLLRSFLQLRVLPTSAVLLPSGAAGSDLVQHSAVVWRLLPRTTSCDGAARRDLAWPPMATCGLWRGLAMGGGKFRVKDGGRQGSSTGAGMVGEE